MNALPRKSLVLALLALLSVPLISTAQPKRAITFDDLISFGRVSDPRISPDGSTVAFVVTVPNKAANRMNSNIFLVPLNGGPVRQLTSANGANNSPRWMPDGKAIAFISTRDGESQIWMISVDGGEARKVSSISTEASGLIVSPDGKWFAFSSDVFPDCQTDDCNKQRMEAMEKSKVKAKVFESLPYRVWNSWKDGKRSHLFVMPSTGGTARDLTPGDFDTPPIDLGGAWDYAFSPDSKEIAFERNTDPVVAVSTNNDIYVVPVAGGVPTKITDNPANDSQPLYSPDGKYIAWRAMKRPGFEADQNQITLYDRATGKLENVSAAFDYSFNEVQWSPDSRSLYCTADDKGNETIFRISIPDKNLTVLKGDGYNTSIAISPDGRTMAFLSERANKPTEVYRMDADGKNVTQLSFINADRTSQLDLNPVETFWFEGAGGTKVEGLLLKPPAFDESKKYPVAFLVHGGPQGQWEDNFHYRWSAEMFASRGYVVVMVNPRGSTGYGQKFTDEISGDWGGKVYADLMNGLDYVLKTYKYTDAKRVAAAGASYGGYMMNWLGTHTNRFTCIVTHDGVFNPVSMYGTTEELWFPQWEFKGTPYNDPKLYEKWSPLNYANNFKTPTLVVHSQLDYRVDVSEGFQLFTALQRHGVKSKMLYFPDEGHFVTKPQNAELWYKTVLDWIDEYTR
ncbi:MAG TPA: S9 family peptidase [Bacteroidota bacterium]|nr:S9 family peptidase [Bacteroidota bacterium]